MAVGISPLLANLFLHYTFDVWMTKNYPNAPWCRYADDGLVHCRSVKEAKRLGLRWKRGLRNAASRCIQQKPRLLTAKMEDALGRMTIPSLLSLAMSSGAVA